MRSARALARILAVAATGVLLASTPGTPDEQSAAQEALRHRIALLRGTSSGRDAALLAQLDQP